jgi:four helix bundle protein
VNYRSLRVYQLSIEILPLINEVCASVPRGYGTVSDELKRAGLGISRNIAEGSGKRTQKNRERFMGDARGSAMECGAVLDGCIALSFVTKNEVRVLDGKLIEIVKMLSTMCGDLQNDDR